MTLSQEIINLLPFPVSQITFHHKGENEVFVIKSSGPKSKDTEKIGNKT
jgi:hypothetical protein